MFKVILFDGINPLPEDSIYYLMTKDGLFQYKNLDLIESLVPVKKVSFLQEVKSYAKLKIPKIPQEIVGQVASFFREVYTMYKAEAIVLIYYNLKDKTYLAKAPFQKVSSASLSYTKGMVVEDHIPVCTIHSHADFSAFHSGTDVADEAGFDGLHVTFGNVDDPAISISSEVVVNGTRFKCDPELYLEGIEHNTIEENVQDDLTYELDGVTVTYGYKHKKIVAPKSRYKVFESEFPEEWSDCVEGTRPTYPGYKYKNSSYFDTETFLTRNFERKTSPTYNRDNFLPIFRKRKEEKESGGTSPCESCSFKNFKKGGSCKQSREEEMAEIDADIDLQLRRFAAWDDFAVLEEDGDV